MNRMNKTQFRMLLTYFFLAVSIIVAYKVAISFDSILISIKIFLGWLSPFLYGAVLAYMLSIPCAGMQLLLEKKAPPYIRKRAKGFSILLVYVIFVLIIYIALWTLVPRVYNSVMDFANQFPTIYSNFEKSIIQLEENELLPFDSRAFLDSLSIKNLLDSVGIKNVLTSLGTVLSGASYVLNWVLTFISSIYILFEAHNIRAYTKRLMSIFLPKKANGIVLKYAESINYYCKKYIYCLLIDCMVIGAITSLEFTLLGSRYALFLGMLVGIMNIIPYFGAIIGCTIAIIVMGVTHGVPMAGVTAIMLLVTQQLDSNVLQPRLFGESMKISPLLVIISVTMGGAIGGVMGMVVAIPITTVFKNILDDIIVYKERTYTQTSSFLVNSEEEV